MQAARQKWRSQQSDWDASRLVFIDESGLNTKMTRSYGRAPRNRRCVGAVPHGHWHTNTFIAALRTSGLTSPWLLDGPMNGASFLVYIQKVLGPDLRKGDIVICDNLSSHKVAGVREALQEIGVQLIYLPPYSPDLNPIEMAFAKLKAHLRKKEPRTKDELLTAVTEAILDFPPEQCTNFVRHSHYTPN